MDCFPVFSEMEQEVVCLLRPCSALNVPERCSMFAASWFYSKCSKYSNFHLERSLLSICSSIRRRSSCSLPFCLFKSFKISRHNINGFFSLCSKTNKSDSMFASFWLCSMYSKFNSRVFLLSSQNQDFTFNVWRILALLKR